ncbi:UNVERIFIED_CONTAM: hypothetical protein K2H54_008050 [Gekko kuhli]
MVQFDNIAVRRVLQSNEELVRTFNVTTIPSGFLLFSNGSCDLIPVRSLLFYFCELQAVAVREAEALFFRNFETIVIVERGLGKLAVDQPWRLMPPVPPALPSPSCSVPPRAFF